MHIVIAGNGAAGAACALAARQRHPQSTITLLGEEAPRPIARTALMYTLMGRMPRQALEFVEPEVWQRERIACHHDRAVDLDARDRTLRLAGGTALPWDRLVLAMGARPRPAPWPGADTVRDGIVHMVRLPDLDQLARLVPSTRHAVVVGGGLIGIELVEVLLHLRVRTTFVLRDPWFWPATLCRGEGERVIERLRQAGATVLTNTTPAQLHPDPQGRITQVDLTCGRTLACDLLGVCIGVEPDIGQLDAWTHAPERARGVLVNPDFATSLDGIWAAGDCAELTWPDGTRQVETLWYSARRHGHAVGGTAIWGEPVDYRPPTFHNSARFLDLEYTTVGTWGRDDPGLLVRRWTHPTHPLSIHMLHDGSRVLGFSVLGGRVDHEALAAWVDQSLSPDEVTRRLPTADFSTEFSRVPWRQLRCDDSPLADLRFA
jgi:NADPH-dependent 2,4-dienoyl-CoA reductase/sulfur reductase-like enzyme